jgi:hypothetical protein
MQRIQRARTQGGGQGGGGAYLKGGLGRAIPSAQLRRPPRHGIRRRVAAGLLGAGGGGGGDGGGGPGSERRARLERARLLRLRQQVGQRRELVEGSGRRWHRRCLQHRAVRRLQVGRCTKDPKVVAERRDQVLDLVLLLAQDARLLVDPEGVSKVALDLLHLRNVMLLQRCHQVAGREKLAHEEFYRLLVLELAEDLRLEALGLGLKQGAKKAWVNTPGRDAARPTRCRGRGLRTGHQRQSGGLHQSTRSSFASSP